MMTGSSTAGDQKVLETLRLWEARLRKSQSAHYIVAERYSTYSTWLRVPLVLVTALASTTVITSFFDTAPVWVNYLAGTLSILGTTLAALLTATRTEEQSHVHERIAAKYGKIRRQIETFLSHAQEDNESIKFIEEVERRWDIIAEDAPVTPSWARLKASKKK